MDGYFISNKDTQVIKFKIFVITRYTNVYETIITNVIEFDSIIQADAAITQINTNIITGISVTAIRLY